MREKLLITAGGRQGCLNGLISHKSWIQFPDPLPIQKGVIVNQEGLPVKIKTYVLSKTDVAMTTVDVLSNGEMILHELYRDPSLQSELTDNYNYHVVFSLRGDNAQRLYGILKQHFEAAVYAPPRPDDAGWEGVK